ncbi:MAG: flagellar brake protein [Planctomycetota bacterium]|nr:flagellar brake protein [Planctomycetota bacterium]
MPANRSRTDRWRECLQQISERGGGIEFAFARADQTDAEAAGEAGDLMWRVHVLGLSNDEILVEHPSAMGQPLNVREGAELVVVMAVGQNRWMFRTRAIGTHALQGPRGHATRSLRLMMPAAVERCQRRNFLRVGSASLNLVRTRIWPLLDPSSVVLAEAANRDLFKTGGNAALGDDRIVLPEVGPSFDARLMNIGGGGVGLLVNKNDASAASRARMVWMMLDLTPTLSAPLAVTARIAHTHIDSEQNLYLGTAFEFTFNIAHRSFVVDQVLKYVNQLQLRVAA